MMDKIREYAREEYGIREDLKTRLSNWRGWRITMGMQLYSRKQDGSVHSKQTRTNQHNFRVAWNCNLYSEWLSSMSPSFPLYLRASIYPRVSPWPCKACRVLLFFLRLHKLDTGGSRKFPLSPSAFYDLGRFIEISRAFRISRVKTQRPEIEIDRTRWTLLGISMENCAKRHTPSFRLS